MTDQIERYLREEFTADADRAPVAGDLVGAARGQVRARRRHQAVLAAGVAVAGVVAASTVWLAAPRQPVDQIADPGSTGRLPIDSFDMLDGARALSVRVTATAFDSACATELSATAQESATTITISVQATSAGAGPCPLESRRVLVTLQQTLDRRAVLDAVDHQPVPLGGPDADGDHPGDPSFPLDDVRLLDGGMRLTLIFYGNPEDSGHCGTRYLGTVRESAARVEVRVKGESTKTYEERGGVCHDIAGRRTVTVQLSRALGERALYDAAGRRLHPG